MHVLWRNGASTVRQVLNALAPDQQLAYTTVMTVMSRLAEKGLLRREAIGASYRYAATLNEDEYAARVTQRLARELIARFGEVAVAQFAAELERLEPERQRRLSQLAAEGDMP